MSAERPKDLEAKLLDKLKTRMNGKPGSVSWNIGPGSMQTELEREGWTLDETELAARGLQRLGNVELATSLFHGVVFIRLIVRRFDAPAASAGSEDGVPVEQQHMMELAATVQHHPELEPDVLVHHIEESDATFENGNWHPSIGQARCFLEGLIENIAKAESTRRCESIPNLPSPGEKRPSFSPCRNYLQRIGFTQSEDDSRISECYSDASKHGSHPRIVDEDTAKLLRDYCWSTGCYILAKYGRWKNNGHRW